jgi:hypothetical protein
VFLAQTIALSACKCGGKNEKNISLLLEEYSFENL